jgi:hypothetical protein
MKRIVICGSMDFFEEMASIAETLGEHGVEALLPVAEEGKVDYRIGEDDELARLKQIFIDAHLKKIRESEAILVANFDKRGVRGYVGANTLMEAAFAYALQKRIYVLHALGEQACRPEMLGMQPIFLDGAVNSLYEGSCERRS